MQIEVIVKQGFLCKFLFLWRLKFYKISRSTVSKKWKKSAVEEDERSTSRSKQREGQRDNKILFNNEFVMFLCCFLQ